MSTDLTGIVYIASPSVGHEIGIMFGFLGAMALTVVVYVIVWQHGNEVGRRREADRVEALRSSGWLKEKQEHEGESTKELHDEIPM